MTRLVSDVEFIAIRLTFSPDIKPAHWLRQQAWPDNHIVRYGTGCRLNLTSTAEHRVRSNSRKQYSVCRYINAANASHLTINPLIFVPSITNFNIPVG